jgi:uncharacterized protein (DUF1697 family)
MALVVFLRGVNIGGHRVFRPSALPAQLPELGVVNIGAAGTFVVGRRVGRAELRRAFRRKLPFAAEIVVCDGAQVRAMMAADLFAGLRLRPGMVRFVSILSGTPKVAPQLPIGFPAGRRWLVKLIARTDCFVAGVYRRDMKTIGYLGRIDRLFDVALTTRNWNTFTAIARVLDASRGRGV